MKYLGALIIALLVGLVCFNFVSAQERGRFTVTQSVTVNPVCMNFGYDPLPYNWSKIDLYLTKLKAAKINCLRLAYYGYAEDIGVYNGEYIPETLANHIRAWSRNNNWRFYLTIGGSWDDPINASDLAKYDANVLALAAWAEPNGIERISLGNEQESRLGDMSVSSWAAHIDNLAGQVRNIYHGEIVYDIRGDYIQQYCPFLHNLSKVGVNIYADHKNLLQSAINCFGKTHVYVSETNMDMEWDEFNNQPFNNRWTNSDSQHAYDWKIRLNAMQALGVPIYYFAWSAGGDGVDTRWGLFNNGVLSQPKTAAVMGIK